MAPPTIASCCLTAEQKDSLIEAVYERPVIWDCSTADYQDVQNRRSAFAEVADLLSDDKNRYTGPEMQVEWKKLRDIFNRTLKKVVSNGGNDTDVTWRYWQKLQFIADHERSQIFKAMHKWTKKVPSAASSSPTKRRSSAANSNRRSSNHPNHLASLSSSSLAADDSASMVLAEVAQTARDLLAMGNGEDGQMMKEEETIEEGSDGGGGEYIGEQQEEEEEEDGEDETSRNTQPLDPFGQFLLLGSQIQNAAETSNGIGLGLSNGCSTFPENGGELPRLLNELLSKGVSEATTSGGERNGGRKKAVAVMNGGTKRARMETAEPGESRGGRIKVEKLEKHKFGGTGGAGRSGGGGGWSQQQQEVIGAISGNGTSSDQFDIFGMFIASQVRTLHSKSPQFALRLKRAITDMCFQYEAEQDEDEE